ncbi:LysM peptidoglycan-binding domain-containing protein [Alteromonas sediminis]|uniref:LysM peptidoglycan-binding domain-containing protein n=2 Tax=Alteromonas sediminis TaxID=2259342 RepID=A0A3N5Y4P7_9ALTE|nr:LysM peptidoglycan-binding domain-containing protein [Alteromonas sediminis]
MQLSFPLSEHKRVSDRIRWYKQQPHYMTIISERAEPFLYYIVTEVEKRGLPLELALVPLFESDFNTRAYSNKHASGLWQLTPLIAKHYGVIINDWYDGRLDIVESTRAALDFLTYLHTRFDGNWFHAIAAYNAGEGRVAQAIRRNQRAGKPTDFFSLRLPKETRHFVPKLLAAAALLHEGEIDFPTIANQQVIELVPMRAGVVIDDLETWREVGELNPGYRRFPAMLSGSQHVLLRLNHAQKWQQYLDSMPQIHSEQWQSYTIRNGDSLSVIAERFALSVTDIKTFNQLKTSRIRAGDKLILPIPAEQQIEYQVKSGDSLWRIARAFNVSVQKLKQWNGLSRSNLSIGDTLTIFLAP